jgi:hypothetical protein
MELSALARAQKRLKFWRDFVSNTTDLSLRGEVNQLLDQYEDLIFGCWERGAFNEQDHLRLQTLERELQSLNEAARMTGLDY